MYVKYYKKRGKRNKYRKMFDGPVKADYLYEVWEMFSSPVWCKEQGIKQTAANGDMFVVADCEASPIRKQYGEYRVALSSSYTEPVYYFSEEEKSKLRDELLDTYPIVSISGPFDYDKPLPTVKPGKYTLKQLA